MISYELTLQLKKAGFPQINCKEAYYLNAGESSGAIVDATMYHNVSPSFQEEKLVAIPDLEELIESCEGKFYGLFKSQDIFGNIKWFATTQETDASFTTGMISDNPKEAVIKLWLQLNKK